MKNNQTGSIDLWYKAVVLDEKIETKQIINALKNEIPDILSVVFERYCAFNCLHCAYPKEITSRAISENNRLEEIVLNIVSQMPDKKSAPSGRNPYLLHVGRSLSPWHLNVMSEAQRIRPDLDCGLIDNGLFVRHLAKFKELDFKLSHIDISCDGNEQAHNKQRNNLKAFQVLLEGLKNARQVLRDDGRICTPYTYTHFNYDTVLEAGEFLLKDNLSDNFLLSSFSPNRSTMVNRSAREVGADEFKEMWQQFTQLSKNFPDHCSIRLYRYQELEKLAMSVGIKKFLEALHNTDTVRVGTGYITFLIDGIRVSYTPISTWPCEELVIDADSVCRTAYSSQFTIQELRAGKSSDGLDTKPYTVAQLTSSSDYGNVYRQVVDQWWQCFGLDYLKEEANLFKKLKKSC